MEIKNVTVNGLKEAIIRSGYPMRTDDPPELNEFAELADSDFKRALNLSKADSGTGHNNFLIGITVSFDLKYPQYWTKHLQRYHWFQYYSGQSIMHRITHIEDITSHCNSQVFPEIIDEINKLISTYNGNNFPAPFKTLTKWIMINDKEECFDLIINNLPMGYNLWVPVVTNYLQLKTMYHQRKNHRLKEWREFCKWIESLPFSYLITGLNVE